MALAVLASPAWALTFPTADEVINRVLAASKEAQLTSADVVIAFRFGSATGRPECVFRGRLDTWPDGSRLTVAKWTPSPVCWAIQHFVVKRLLSDRDHAGALLPHFHFDVLGESLVDGHPYYLLKGTALSPGTEPRWAIGWVDYDRGLVTDDTVQYGAIRVDTTQKYGRVAGMWLPVSQHIDVPRFRASLDITYDNIRVVPSQ